MDDLKSTESPVSITTYLTNENGVNFQLTIRSGATASEVEAVLDVFAGAMKYLKDKYKLIPTGSPRASSSPPPVDNEPPGLPPQKNGNGSQQETLTFEAANLVGSIKDGQTYWKIKGGRFSKWGVTVWPEVLEEAGFVFDQLDPMQTYSLPGYTAHYVVEDGKPKKVVALVK